MSFRVLKFGGSSVGSPDNLLRVLEIIVRERTGGPLAVVVSAMADTTDWLIEAADLAGAGKADEAEATASRVAALAIDNANEVVRRSETKRVPPFDGLVNDLLAPMRDALRAESLVRGRSLAFRDYVLSFGERVSSVIVTALLEARGVPAVAVDARQWTLTDDHFGAARVSSEESFRRVGELSKGWGDRVAVHTGFIGATADGRTTTLGRNGSDYTAALLAAALKAPDLTVWTDVSGVLTADPGLVPEAYPVPHLSQREALELANLGFAMFHPRTMVPLIEAGVPLRIRNTTRPDEPGTLVDGSGSEDASRPSCIVTLEDLALVEVEYAPKAIHPVGIGQRVLRALEHANIAVRISTQSPLGRAASVVVQERDLRRATHLLSMDLAGDMERGDVEPLKVRAPVTLVTLMAEAIGQGSNVAGRFFGALGAVGINVRAAAQGASSRSIACVVDASETSLAARSVHAAFNLAHSEVSLLVLGKGVVGGQLLSQIQEQAAELCRKDGVLLRVVGIVGKDRALFDEKGIDLSSWKDRYATAPATATGPEALGPLLDRLVRLPVPILVDCTAADGMESTYVEAFARGIHVVGANKKPLALSQKERDALMDVARRHHRLYLYETTVGASLPVIATLKDLVRTGDRVRLIEGSFSGTLGYLVNELMRGVPLSRAVAIAREKGYTEPHPRDDLSGLDVARKGLILARELGYEVALEDVQVEPFVPQELLGEDDVDAFFRALATLDAEMTARIDRLKAEGKVLRYLARIDPSAGGRGQMVKVGPVAIESEHAATRLRGSEAFVAFTTERYSDYPLVVQGSGAGGAVTAAGVLADVLKVTQTLRGR